MTDAEPPTAARAPSAVETPSSGRRALALIALGAATLGTTAVVLAPRHGVPSTLLVVVSTVAAGVFVGLELRSPTVRIHLVATAVGVVLLVAISAPPLASNDIWSYTMYGRMVSVHDASPYDHVPADFPSDPFQHRVSGIWQHRGSVYGPAFVAYAAGVTFAAGDSVLVDRLLFQLGAALVVVLILGVVWRRTGSAAAVAWLGLHPLFGGVVVNSGQIDAFIGLTILAAAIFAFRRRPVLCGIALAVASLVKVTSLLALVGIVVWAWRKGWHRFAAATTAVTGAAVAAVYLPFVAGATHVLSGADHTVTPGAAWNLPAQLAVGKDAGRDLAARFLPDGSLDAIFYVSAAVVAVLAVVVAWRWSRTSTPDASVGGATAAYTMAAEYTLPWYAAWAMPVLADRRPSRLAWLVWLQASVMLAAWKLPTHHTGDVADTVLRGTFAYALPVVLVVAFVAVAPRAVGARRDAGAAAA